MKMIPLLLGSFFLPCAALANDGFGGMSATGLTFGQTEAVQMQTEDLYISPTAIKVDYQFNNASSKDVTGEVIFPLPPISLWAIYNGSFNLPENPDRENLVNFTASVDGADVPVSIDRVAIKYSTEDDWANAAEQYDTPGEDVTATLTRLGVPISIDTEVVTARLIALPQSAKDELTAAGLAEFYETDGMVDAMPQWGIVLRYHWTQTFPAGKLLQISHSYENYPAGGIFGWQPGPDTEGSAEVRKTYCVDDGTSKAMSAALRREENGETSYEGNATFMEYVLRTANSWAGPIGKFRLTLDKGAVNNVLSFCGEGVKKTGPTTFVTEIDNFVPTQDLKILVVTPFMP